MNQSTYACACACACAFAAKRVTIACTQLPSLSHQLQITFQNALKLYASVTTTIFVLKVLRDNFTVLSYLSSNDIFVALDERAEQLLERRSLSFDIVSRLTHRLQRPVRNHAAQL